MKRTEPRVIWLVLHRYVGLVALLFLGFAAITGCALCFRPQLDVALNGDLFTAKPAASPIDVARAVDRFQVHHPELRVETVPLNPAANRTIPIAVTPAHPGATLPFNQAFLDLGDGHLIGTRSDAAAWSRRGAAALLHDIHYTLLGGRIGTWLMGTVALAWLISNAIGAYLTFPLRPPLWKNWKRMWRFSFSSQAPRLLLDLHRSSGLWLFVPLLALAFTSAAMNFFDFYAPVVAKLARATPSPFDKPAPYPAGVSPRIGFAEAVRRVRLADRSSWKPATVSYFPDRKLYGVELTDDGSVNYHYLGPYTWLLDGDSGRVVQIESPYVGNTGLALIRMLYPVHSGHGAGFVGVAIIFVAGLATLLQCVTGVYLWWKKRKSRVLARRAPRKA